MHGGRQQPRLPRRFSAADESETIAHTVGRITQGCRQLGQHGAFGVRTDHTHRSGKIGHQIDRDSAGLAVDAHLQLFEGIAQTGVDVEAPRIRRVEQRDVITKTQSTARLAAGVGAGKMTGRPPVDSIMNLGRIHG